MHAWVMTVSNYGCRFSDLDVGACIFQENVPIEISNISIESTQNKQQYGTKITCTEVRETVWWLEMGYNFFLVFHIFDI